MSVNDISEMSLQEAVASGAAWLDSIKPGWEHQIDLGVLDLSSGCRCVLGQVFAAEAEADMGIRYPHGFYGLDFTPRTNGFFYSTHKYDILPWNMGFDSTAAYSFADLDEAWIDLIKARMNA